MTCKIRGAGLYGVRGLTRVLWLLVLTLGAARADHFPPWQFTLPEVTSREKEVKDSYNDGILGYTVRGVTYLFTPPEALGKRSLEQVARELVVNLSGNGADVSGPRAIELQSGQTALVFLAFTGPVNNQQKHLYQFFSAEGQWGASIAVFSPEKAEDERAEEEAVEVMHSLKFSPSPMSQLVSPKSTSRLNVPPWPKLRPDRVVASAAQVSGPQARKLGLDPEKVPLPDTFDCYRATPRNAPASPMTPTPTARLTIKQGTYTYATGAETSSGRWWIQTKGWEVGMDGVLESEQVNVDWTDNGQIIYAKELGQDITCFQAGPAAEAFRLRLQKAYLSGETWTCVDKGNQPASLKFDLATSTYTHSRGSGRFVAGYDLAGNAVSASLFFRQGPFHLLTGKLTEDDYGNRELTLSFRVETNTALTSQSRESTIAVCSARTTPKPAPTYGPNKAPSTGYKGGLSGLYLWPRTYTYMSGMIQLQGMNWAVTQFMPDGYFADDLSLVGGALPDCTRTHPNGEAICQRYEVKGNTFRTQQENGTWDSESFTRKGTTLIIGGEEAYPLPAVKGPLNGLYTSDNLQGTNLGVSTGTINSFSNAFQFTAGGQFTWRSSSSSSFSVGAGGFSTDIIAGGGSSRTQTDQGLYQFSHPTLTLKFSGGQEARYLAFTLPPELANTWKELTRAINISGTWYSPVK